MRIGIVVIIGLTIVGALWIGTRYALPKVTKTIPPIQSGQVVSDVSPVPQNIKIPETHILANGKHMMQTFNNCGPASLSMALSYYGVDISQAELGAALRPYQISHGDNDDKSVTLEELAVKAKEYNLNGYNRPNGNITILKHFVASGIPVIVKTWLKENEDIGHYRVVKGYDETTGEIIQDDSYQGKDLRFTYDSFLSMWKKFNYEYLVLVPPDKEDTAKRIIGNDINLTTAWKRAAETAKKEIEASPGDMYSTFNLSVAEYYTGNHEESVRHFEDVENDLPGRTLWYQREPILSYMELKKYDRVLEISDTILRNNNRAYSELYMLRGNIFRERGDMTAAKAEYEKAVYYNKNYTPAIDALKEMGS